MMCGRVLTLSCCVAAVTILGNGFSALATEPIANPFVPTSLQASDSIWLTKPTVRSNPISRTPLICIVDFETRQKTTAVIQISDGENSWEHPVQVAETRHSIALLGLLPGRTHRIAVTARETVGTRRETATANDFTTPPLPANFPPIKTTLAIEPKMEPGIKMFAVNNWTDSTSLLDYGYLIAINSKGQVVWYCHTGDRTADCRVLKNGNILYQHGSYRYLFEIDIFGRDIRSWYAARSTQSPHPLSIAVDVDTLHHDLAELPNGNLLALATELRKFDRYPSDEFDSQAPFGPAWVVCDEIIEFQPETGHIVKRLPLTEKLDTSRFGYLCLNRFWKDKYDEFIDSPCRDWSHANAIQYLPQDNCVLVSFRHLSCVIKLDWDTNEIKWIFGDPAGWSNQFQSLFLKPDKNLEWPYHQHSPHFTESGLLLMFDNGNYRAVPYQQPILAPDNSSRIAAFRLNQQTKFVEQVYSYGSAQGDHFYSPFYGEADVLSRTRNLLVTDGGHIETVNGIPDDLVPGERQWGRIFEITSGSTAEKVFELVCESKMGSKLGWSIYRCNQYASLYEPFAVIPPKSTEAPQVHQRGAIRKLNPLNSYAPARVEATIR